MAAKGTRYGWVAVVLVGGLSLGISACSGTGSNASPSQSLNDALNTAIHDQLQGNLSAAKSQYNEVLKADPTNVYAHYNLGLIAQTQHQGSTAEAQYRLALQSNPNFEPALFNLAIVLTGSAPAEAVTEYERAITVNPNDANAHFNLGLLLIKTGQTSTATRRWPRRPSSTRAWPIGSRTLRGATRSLRQRGRALQPAPRADGPLLSRPARALRRLRRSRVAAATVTTTPNPTRRSVS